MDMTGQFHASAALPPGKEPPVPIGLEAGWPPEPVAPVGYRTPTVQPLAHRYTD
jgi:hypothetical protein